MNLRRSVAVGLERLHLEHAAYRLYERALTVPALPELVIPSRRVADDGPPLPPPLLRVQVNGTASPAEFVAQGQRAAATIAEVVSDAGRTMEQLESVLDFGCGCGRVMRRWSGLAGPQLYGCDYNKSFIAWCAANLPFAYFRPNTLAPPLPFEDEQFELIYALSVFTHLTEPLQHEWMAELRRVLKPGGLLLITTRGTPWAWKLEGTERDRFDAGELVVRYGETEGTNLCAAFHPWSYVQDGLAPPLTLLKSYEAKMQDGAQDVHLMQKDSA